MRGTNGGVPGVNMARIRRDLVREIPAGVVGVSLPLLEGRISVAARRSRAHAIAQLAVARQVDQDP
jgi:hypothetical protein